MSVVSTVLVKVHLTNGDPSMAVMEASDICRMKELEEENRQLKQMYAELRLTRERKNWVLQLQNQFDLMLLALIEKHPPFGLPQVS